MIACNNCVHYEVCKIIIGERELFINDIACRFSSKCGAYKNAETFVEIVRCKDCKHYMTIHCTCDGCCISDDWYCADGERKDK